MRNPGLRVTCALPGLCLGLVFLLYGVFMLIKRDCGAVRLYINARGQWVAQWIIDSEPLPVVALFDTESGALAYALSSEPPPLE